MKYFSVIYIVTLFALNNMYAFDDSLKIGGFISQGYLKTNKNNYLADTEKGSFQFNEMGLNFSILPTSNLRVGCQFFARDLGDIGNDEIVINWAIAEYKSLEWMGMRAGILKIPHGFYNDTRDMDMLRVFIFLPGARYNEWLRDGANNMKGIELFGNIHLGSFGDIEYRVLKGETNVSQESGTVKFFQEINGVLKDVSDIQVDPIFIPQITWTTLNDNLKLYAHYSTTGYEMEGVENKSDIGLRVILNVDNLKWFVYAAELTIGDLIATFEYEISHMDINVALAESGAKIPPAEEINSDRYYFSLSYRFSDWFQLGAYYSKYINDNDTTGPANELKEAVVCARFDINNNWLVKVEYHKMDGLFGVEPEKDGSLDKDWNLYALKMSYSF